MISHFEEFRKEFFLTQELTIDALAQAKMLLNSPKAAVEKIKNFCDRATRHVSLQSEGFYRVLRAHHQDNSSALKKIDFFENDLKELRVKLFVFTEKYFSDQPVRRERLFVSDFNAIAKDVLERISVENSQLCSLMD